MRRTREAMYSDSYLKRVKIYQAGDRSFRILSMSVRTVGTNTAQDPELASLHLIDLQFISTWPLYT